MPATSKPLVEEIEPKFVWEKIEGCDTLLVHLTGYLKENLKVQVTTSRNLRVIGERKGNDGKPNRFQNEFSLPEDCDVNGITAKFEGGILKIKLPKIPGSAQQKEIQKHEINNTLAPPSASTDQKRDDKENKIRKPETEADVENRENEEKKKYKEKIEGKLRTKKVMLLVVVILGVGVALGLRMLQSNGNVRKFVNDIWGVKMNNTSQNVIEKSCICEM